ncbi:hypothetical protein Tco_0511225, partial [Tanacetum coccineum]
MMIHLSSRKKFKDAKILIDELVPPGSSVFIPFPNVTRFSMRIFPRLMLCLRPIMRTRIAWIFEASRALGFCPSFTRASNPQLHFGNPISKSYRLTKRISMKRTENEAKNDKTEHRMEEREKDNFKIKVKVQKVKVNPDEVK